MRIADIMTEDPVSVGPENTLGEAILRMLEVGSHHLPVTRAGRLVGMLSDRDLSPNARAHLPDVESLLSELTQPVSELMSERVLSLTPDRDVVDAVDLMLEYSINAVPVVDPGSDVLVGVVTSYDVLRHARQRLWG